MIGVVFGNLVTGVGIPRVGAEALGASYAEGMSEGGVR